MKALSLILARIGCYLFGHVECCDCGHCQVCGDDLRPGVGA